MLQRPGAAVLERYLSSRSPPDHLLYQMLKIVPVCGGGSDFIVDGSTCGRAGRRFLRMIVLVFLGWRAPSSSVGLEDGMRSEAFFVVIREVSWACGPGNDGAESIFEGMLGGIELPTWAIMWKRVCDSSSISCGEKLL